MVYRDNEEKLFDVLKRVVVQRGEIVCYVVLHSAIGQEEPWPDVENMLPAYLLDNKPGVVLFDDVSAMMMDVLCKLPVAELASDSMQVVAPSTNISESNTAYLRLVPSGDDSIANSSRDER